jgi:uncharacterized protein
MSKQNEKLMKSSTQHYGVVEMAGPKQSWEKAADIVAAAGGQIVGRTKFQKIAYLLELAGLGNDFKFEYRHYGPYSEDLSDAVKIANAFGLVKEEERRAEWGGMYSIFSTDREAPGGQKATFTRTAATVGAIELELAATAAYLYAVERCTTPWEETKRRKPEKATPDRIQGAKEAYAQLRRLKAPKALPDF